MQPSPAISRPGRRGFALLITLVFLAIMLAAYAGLMGWVSTNSHITTRNNLFGETEAAAESATESVLAVMMRDFNSQALNTAATYANATNLPSQSGWPGTFLFSDTNGVTNATSVTAIGNPGWTNLPARYSGLSGWGQVWDIASTTTPQNTADILSATVDQRVWFGTIPIFQFAIFYNMDLEINPGAAMTINGKVHSNDNIYATGDSATLPLTFSDLVEAAIKYYSTPDPLDPGNTAAGRSGNVDFTLSNNNPVYPVSSLSLPIGTNNNPAAVMGILAIPPAGVNPASSNGQSYVYNEADLVVSNSLNGATNYVYYQNFNMTPSQTLVQPDVTNIVSGTTNYYYSFVTNATFYDYRQAETVQAVQLNVGKLNTWLTTNPKGETYNSDNNSGITSKGHPINGVYVYNSVANTSSQLPAVRVMNGQQLPSGGLTVATQFPIYVMGNYNITTNGTKLSTALGDTTNTVPAALMGDAVTVLSSNWSDSYNSSTPLTGSGGRTPTATTINAATMEGIVPSNGTYYSGGVENFLRLLENWSNINLNYNGSIVVLFDSQYATAPWPGTGSVYNPPNRNWGFDLNFNQSNRLPPMTPQVRATIRESWSAR